MTPNTLDYEVLREHWAILALLGGIAVTIWLWLIYSALWKPRGEEASKGKKTEIEGIRTLSQWLVAFMPWAIIVALISTLAYTVVHVLLAALRTPNW